MITSNCRAVLTASAIAVAAGVAQADVRVVHASPDAPNVDIYVNGDPASASPNIANLPFTQATPYVPLPSDTYRFRVTPNAAPAPVVIDVTTPIDGNTDYTVVAVDFLNSIEALLLTDDNTIDPNAARVRFVHASPDAPTVDIFAAGGVDPLFDAISFRGVGDYISVPAGTYDLEVRLDAGGALALPVPGLTLEAGTVYTVFAMGSVAGGTLQAVPVVDAIPAPGSLALLGLGGLAAMRRRR